MVNALTDIKVTRCVENVAVDPLRKVDFRGMLLGTKHQFAESKTPPIEI